MDHQDQLDIYDTQLDKYSCLAGAKKVFPVILGATPFAFVIGATTRQMDISPLDSFFMSLIIYAGSAQIAALNLMTEKTPILIIIFTGLVINLRLMMFSASLAPHVQKATPLKKLLIGFLLTDQPYAISIQQFSIAPTNIHKISYYFGAASTVFFVWMSGILLGIFLGNIIPSWFEFEFAIPLTFLFLLLGILKSIPSCFAATSAAFVSIATCQLPYNLNIVTGAIVGIITGVWSEHFNKRNNA